MATDAGRRRGDGPRAGAPHVTSSVAERGPTRVDRKPDRGIPPLGRCPWMGTAGPVADLVGDRARSPARPPLHRRAQWRPVLPEAVPRGLRRAPGTLSCAWRGAGLGRMAAMGWPAAWRGGPVRLAADRGGVLVWLRAAHSAPAHAGPRRVGDRRVDAPEIPMRPSDRKPWIERCNERNPL